MEFRSKTSDVVITIMYPGVKAYLPSPDIFRDVTQLAFRDDPNSFTRPPNGRLIAFDKHGETIVGVDECKRPFAELKSEKLPVETLTQAVARVERNFSEVEHLFSIVKGDNESYELTFYYVSSSAIAHFEQAEKDVERYATYVSKQGEPT